MNFSIINILKHSNLPESCVSIFVRNVLSGGEGRDKTLMKTYWISNFMIYKLLLFYLFNHWCENIISYLQIILPENILILSEIFPRFNGNLNKIFTNLSNKFLLIM